MKTIRVAAAVICEDRNAVSRVFATARGYGEYKGRWEFPGGKLEEGESGTDAIIREIREELNTEIDPFQLLCTVEYDYSQFHLSMDCYLCSVVSGKLELLEAMDAGWFSLEELDSVEWLPADLDVVAELKVFLCGNGIEDTKK